LLLRAAARFFAAAAPRLSGDRRVDDSDARLAPESGRSDVWPQHSGVSSPAGRAGAAAEHLPRLDRANPAPHRNRAAAAAPDGRLAGAVAGAAAEAGGTRAAERRRGLRAAPRGRWE